MANRMIRLRRLEPPDSAVEAFFVVQRAGLIPQELALSMKRMVGFRNVAVHADQELDVEKKVRQIIEHRLDDLARVPAAP